MIIDCFTFYNELELLEIRLEELKGVVDWFVMIEGCETFSGKPKDYVFEANSHLFTRYPICYIKLPRFPQTLTTSWQREAYTRNAIMEGLRGTQPGPNDIIMLSDIGEIPRAEIVMQCGQLLSSGKAGTCFVLTQTFYYFVNGQMNQLWQGTRMTRYRDLSSFHELRASSGIVIPNAGWHFSYLGGINRIQDKIGASVHTELDKEKYKNSMHIEECLAAGKDLFDRDLFIRYVPLDMSFPAYLVANQEKFRHLIKMDTPCLSSQSLFLQFLARDSDIQQHLGYLYRLASTVNHITEFGTGNGLATSAFLYAQPKRLITYDLERTESITSIEEAAEYDKIDFTFRQEDVLHIDIEPTDLLFIDTWQVEQQIREELRLHAHKVYKYLVFHDTEMYAFRGASEPYRGIWLAIAEYTRSNPEWRLLQHYQHNNGLTVLTRVK